jgi:hypothetical protein
MGKGSKQRPRTGVSQETYAASWDATFGKRGDPVGESRESGEGVGGDSATGRTDTLAPTR